jgi:hypothetical protein
MPLSLGPPPPALSTGRSEQRRGRNERKGGASAAGAPGTSPVKYRKERDPNWSRLKMMALVRAKYAEFMDELQSNDPREFMNSDVTQWKRVSLSMNAGPSITCYRSSEACKYKWQTLLPEYKRVADVHKETGTNSLAFFEMSFGERRKRELSKIFDPYVYEEMHTWLRHKPTMNLLHFRDLLNPLNSNFHPPNYGLDDLHASEDSRGESALHAYASAAKHMMQSRTPCPSRSLSPMRPKPQPGAIKTSPCSPPHPPNRHQLLTFAPGMLRPQARHSSTVG